MKVQAKHGRVTQNMHGARRNYRYVWDVSFVNEELVDVAVGRIVQPGNRVFHGNPMPTNVSRIQLVRVLDGYTSCYLPIDHLEPTTRM